MMIKNAGEMMGKKRWGNGGKNLGEYDGNDGNDGK